MDESRFGDWFAFHGHFSLWKSNRNCFRACITTFTRTGCCNANCRRLVRLDAKWAQGLRSGANLAAAGKSKIRIKDRSEEHTSELQSLMRISYAVCCLKKK